MISVFSGFIGADNSLIKMIGFGLAIAVLFDAFIVWMTLVPAVLAMLGERAWRLPHVDIEGSALLTQRPQPTLTPSPTSDSADTPASDPPVGLVRSRAERGGTSI
jgi:RND superfamily putative drug exporter